MAVEITGRYAGNLRVDLHHGPSGTEIRTAAPVDNNGDGSSFSPTDLLAASLGACMVTVMGIYAQKNGIPFDGVEFRLEKHMRADPRRVDRLPDERPTSRIARGATAESSRGTGGAGVRNRPTRTATLRPCLTGQAAGI